MTIIEVFPAVNGIMAALNTLGDYGFNQDLDLLLLSKCGKRDVSPVVELLLLSSNESTLSTASLSRLASLIMTEYGDGWERYRSALGIVYNPISASQYTERETYTSEGRTTNTSQDVTQRGVATTDTAPSNYISDDQTNVTGNDTGTSGTESTRVLERTSNGTSYKTSDLIGSELDLRLNRRFVAQVIEDVKNYISMPIY